MAKLSARGESAIPEDSVSDTPSEPLLLPANGEAASGNSARDEEATAGGTPKPLKAEVVVGLSRANAAGVPMTVGNLRLPGRGLPLTMAHHQAQPLAAPQQTGTWRALIVQAATVLPGVASLAVACLPAASPLQNLVHQVVPLVLDLDNGRLSASFS